MKKNTLVTVIGNFKGDVPIGMYIGKTDVHYIILEERNGIKELRAYGISTVRLSVVEYGESNTTPHML